MCSIIGINGQNVNNRLFKMLNILKHRGPDATGIYSNDKLFFNEEINDKIDESEFILAHNLLSIVGNNEIQPIKSGNLVLIANAEIYNYEKLLLDYNLDNFKTNSDCEIILKLIEKFYGNNLKEAVLKTISLLDGDYAFCVYDNKDYVAVRDEIGVKPLHYAFDENTFSFSSESKALKAINLNNSQSLNPRYAIVNNSLLKIRDEFTRYESKIPYEDLKNELKTNLLEATKKRTKNLDHVALLFSAGVDSTLIAILLKKLNVNTTLYTIGTENSQDLKFSKKVAKDIDMPLKTWIINQEIIEKQLEDTINTIEDTNLMKIGVGMTIKLTSQLASKDNQKVILSGQGADELFCGYNRYKNKYDTPAELLDELTHDLNNMYHVNLERDDKATMSNSIELRVPFLDRNVIETAVKTPIKYMLHSNEDKIRKHILREVAYEMGVPEYIAFRPKKAAQYGTGIDKIIKKKILKKKEFTKLLENY
ncbi:asparagine synthetase B [Methanosphaera sp.]|uniref:asparagine synthetase B n=1 Tax=Methanosphaera sp. TaxID=2666342 RepID=UPI002E78EC24|nr:asparagine synthetase B [Methanosphaera sp.]MEE1116742.1 asparagine synthetase B [Methanosphaera sp.]